MNPHNNPYIPHRVTGFVVVIILLFVVLITSWDSFWNRWEPTRIEPNYPDNPRGIEFNPEQIYDPGKG